MIRRSSTLSKMMPPDWTLADLNPVNWTFADAATTLTDNAIDCGPKTSRTLVRVGYDLDGNVPALRLVKK